MPPSREVGGREWLGAPRGWGARVVESPRGWGAMPGLGGTRVWGHAGLGGQAGLGGRAGLGAMRGWGPRGARGPRVARGRAWLGGTVAGGSGVGRWD